MRHILRQAAVAGAAECVALAGLVVVVTALALWAARGVSHFR